MNKQKISQALTTGLVAGYGGKTEFSKTTRGGFDLKSSHFQNDQIIYHDEWTEGGGQEIVKIEDEHFTRVYAGKTVDEEILEKLNITQSDVINFLISKIQQLGEKTRLFDDCLTDSQNGWQYEYKILDKNDEINVNTGKETIYYQNHPVFIHVFVLSPIK